MRRSTLAEIAPEILASVFGFLERSDVAQCQLVCGKWSRVAQEKIYKNVVGFESSE